jgi:hypothetical protein
VADTEPATLMDLAHPFSAPPEPVGHSPHGPVAEEPRTGRTRLGRGLGSLLTQGRPPAPPVGGTPTSVNSSEDGTAKPPRRTGDPQATAKIIVGAVGVTIAVASWVLMQRGRKLRRPTRDQIKDFARPVGAILARHTDLSWLGADIEDLGTAAAVVTDYTTDGPIAPRVDPVVHVGMPDHDTPTDPPPDPRPTPPTATVTYLA